MMLDSGNVLCRTTLCEVEMHERILRLITSQQIGKEAGANEEEMQIRNDANFATSCCARIF